MTELTCPSCGETEALSGTPVEDDIRISCQRCGAEWMRGRSRCKRCGQPDGVTVQQAITRTPRGDQVAVLGVRQVPLCPSCDSEAIEAVGSGNRQLPEGYVPRFLFGEVEERPQTETPQSQPPAESRQGSSTTTPSARTGRSESRRPTPRPAPPRSSRQQPARSQLTDPTLRQATEVFLTEAAEPTDSVTMLMLGSRFGASTRLAVSTHPTPSMILLIG